MLVPYRRHSPDCPHRAEGRRYIRCKCPIWAQGTLADEIIRESMDTRVWSKANEIIQGWNAAGTRAPDAPPEPKPQPAGITIVAACAAFKREMAAQKLRDSSQKKYRTMFNQLDAFAKGAGITEVSQIDLDITERFRHTWAKCTASSAGKRLERLRTFQAYLVKHGWIPQNFAKLLKPPKASAAPTLPFSVDEMKALLDECAIFAKKKPRHGQAKLTRLRALMLLCRYSGLRIGDAASLACDRLDGQKLFLYTAKTGTPVYTKLPSFVVDELDRCPRLSPSYWFWTGNGSKEALSENYRRVFREVAKDAGVKGAHPHRFRDTFAVELLLAGVPIEQVSMLLGHSSIKVTQKHYDPWVRSRQQQLEESLDKAIKADPLARREARAGQKLVRVK